MDNPALLFLSEAYGTLKGGISSIYHRLATILKEREPSIPVFSTVLEATEEDKEDARRNRIELLLPKVESGDQRTTPSLDWLTFDHSVKYPNLPPKIRSIVGHTDGTSRAACRIKQDRCAEATVVLFIDDIPEDTEQYRGDERAMGIGKKEDSILEDAQEADVVFSIGDRTFDHFENQFRAIPADKRPRHMKFVPRPSNVFGDADAEYKATDTMVVLCICRAHGLEKLKGLDLAIGALSIVAGNSKMTVKLRVRGVDQEEHRKSANLQITLLPYGTQKDIRKDMLQSHLVLMPSRAEPFGLIGLEAIAVGVPVLVSDKSGLAKLIDDFAPRYHNCIVETSVGGDDQKNVENWARCIEKVLRHCEAEFKTAAMLKKELLSTEYWKASESQFIEVCTNEVSNAKSEDNNKDEAGGSQGSSSDEESLGHSILRTSEKIFDEEVLQDPEKFESMLLDFRGHVDAALPFLSCKAKLRVKRRAPHLVAKVNKVIFSGTGARLKSKYRKLVECFKLFCATLKKVEDGCVLCSLEFEDSMHLKSFLRGYRDGKLSDTLTQELITEEMIQEGGPDLYVHVTLMVAKDRSSSDVSGSEVSEHQAAVRPKTFRKQLQAEVLRKPKPKSKSNKQKAEDRKREKESEVIGRELLAKAAERAKKEAQKEERRRKQKELERAESKARAAVSDADRKTTDKGSATSKDAVDIMGDLSKKEDREEDGGHGDDEGVDTFLDEEVEALSTVDTLFISSSSSSRSSTPSSGYVSSSSTSQTPRDVSSQIGDLRRSVYDYKLACDNCFVKDKGKDGAGAYTYIDNKDHHCYENVLLARRKNADDAFSKVRPRPQHRFFGTYKLCQQFQVSRQCLFGEPRCLFAHSDIEIDLWTRERQGKFNRAELMFQLCETLPSEADAIKQLQQKHGGTFWFLCKECFQSSPTVITDLYLCDQHFPKGRHREDMKLLVHATETRYGETHFTPIMPYPRLKAKQIPLFCAYMDRCINEAERCVRAHSQVEMDVWMLERKYGTSREVLVDSAQQQQQYQKQHARPLSATSSSAQASEHPSAFPLFTPRVSQYYCNLCDKTCNGRVTFDQHCSSEKHQARLRSDESDNWQYRRPPWIGRNEAYKLCQRHVDGSCPYDGFEEDRNNICPYAHSQEELDEWQERRKYRLLNMEMAWKQNLFSYMDKLREEYENTTDGPSIIADSLEEVSVTCEQSAEGRLERKTEEFTWKFKVTSKEPLEHVALLYNEQRTHFLLHGGNVEENCQVAEGKEWFDASDDSYNVQVKGTSQMFGVFSQWVIFDFGKRPVVRRRLVLYVGSVGPDDEHVHVKPDLPDFERWHSGNRSIVKFAEEVNKEDKTLLERYKEPMVEQGEILARLSQQKKELDETVYKTRMHDLLYLEELARNTEIASIRKETALELSDRIEHGILLFAEGGTLYTKLRLQDQLSEDRPAGKLILTDINTVLLAPKGISTNKVYEANIVQLKGFEGRRKEEVYLQLSRRCCRDLHLRSGAKVEFEVRFQLNRLHFCYMHFAVDHVDKAVLHAIFPSREDMSWMAVGESLPTREVQHAPLNAKQKAAVTRILSSRDDSKPPVVLYGPFGTGKTMTMASAALKILQQKDTNVLIATHSNSAADLFIRDYIHRHVESNHPEAKPLRVFAKNRRLDTVDDTVLQYCKLDPDQKSFAMPQIEDITNHRIVIVTLTTSMYLIRMGIKRGHFTHILLDEAAQAMECETILPLCLTDSTTRIVLAGDHKQISPKVYAAEACAFSFDKSLLERMVQRYIRPGRRPTQKVENPFLFMFTDNYRCCEEILRFLSECFYGGLKNMGQQPRHPRWPWYPLTFFSAEGKDKTGDYGTSYFNMAEVLEISERVEKLWKDWPEEWGPPNMAEIGVITPYHNQVQLIRRELRKKHLGDVTVEMVTNIQGKQFRAVFISTVRTRATCDSNNDKNSYGFLSDSKLLNTAMTRAQSLVAVVGDPHALCSLGECQKVWQKFITECEKNESLFPQTLTMSKIYERSESTTLNPEARPFTPRGPTTPGIRSQDGSSPLQGPVPLAKRSTKTDEPDEIIEKLILETLEDEDKDEARRFEAHKFNPDEVAVVPSQSDPTHVYLRYSSGQQISVRRPAPLKQKRPRLGADTADKEYDSGEDEQYDPTQHEVQEESIDQCFYVNLPPNELETLLQTEPYRYRRCRLVVEGTQVAHGEVIGTDEDDIMINGRRNRGLGWANDEVVVEILDNVDEGTEASMTPLDSRRGRVVGVIKPAVSLHLRKFVCAVDGSNTTLMVPINIDAPKLVTYFGKETERRRKTVRVYSYMSDASLRFKKYEEIDPMDPYKKLFVVRFLKWTPRYVYPLGVVTDVIIPDNTLDTNMEILNNKFNVPSKYKGRVAEDVNRRYMGDWQIPTNERDKRKDLSKTHTVFTVDPPEAMDLGHAFSVETNLDGTYTVGIHMADVSYFVPIGSDLDKEAKERSISLYPKTGKPPVHMIPKRLSEGVCSLLPDEDRLALSFFVTLNSDGDIVDEPKLERCVVHSRAQLRYEQAEDIIAGRGAMSVPQEVQDSVRLLHTVAAAHRQRRLGPAHLYHQPDDDRKGAARAHAMAEEMIILANARVAQVLLQRFPQTTPLRTQQPPKEEKMENWKKHHAALSGSSVELSKTLPSEEAMDTPPEDIPLLKEVWGEIHQAVSNGDLHKLQQLVCTDENHPTLARALLQLRGIQDRSVFTCSAQHEPEHNRHYSLNQSAYTYWTSPIRRYIDVVVHRLLVALIAKQPSPYTPDEIQDICSHYNDMESDANAYERETFLLKLANNWMSKPEVVYAVIDTVDEQGMQLLMPSVRHTVSSQRRVAFNLLKPASKPILQDEGESVGIVWYQRIYDTNPDRTKLPSGFDRKRPRQLDGENHVIRIPGQSWQRLVQHIQGGNVGAIRNVVAEIEEVVVKRPWLQSEGRTYAEVSSEGREGQLAHRFQITYKPGQVVKVQLTGDTRKGLLSPCIQLFNLTPKMDVCLEHRQDAVTRFALTATRSVANMTKYRSVEEYQDRWFPIMAMEAAHSAVENNESVIVHGTSISWRKQQTYEGEGYYGEISLSKKFCKDRCIQFTQDYESNVGELSDNTGDADSGKFIDYICVRYTGVRAVMTHDGRFNIAVDKTHEGSALVCWVGHCLVMPGVQFSKRDEDWTITVPIKLHQHVVAFPNALLHHGTSIPATIEIITKTLPDRRMEDAVRWLSRSSDLVQQIATGHRITAEGNKLASNVIIKPLPGFSLNHVQGKAVLQAIRQPFTLIQGPPGTGKTVTGVHIAYYLAKMNNTIHLESGEDTFPTQVLYCGPSNKAVDVITGYMKKIKGDLQIVRMYSEMIEKEDFPVPYDHTHKCQSDKESKITKEHDDVALHHLIRKPSNPHAEAIRDIETRFKDPNYIVTDTDIGNHKDLILEAKVHELRQKHVILCTCTAAASPKMGKATNIEQCIIDECGMCTEPESFVPIVGAPVERTGSLKFHNPKQVILIGDHQQLKPIVLEKKSLELGLDTSLFQRYAREATMLTTQYRMHEAICSFPSRMFYGNKLDTDPKVTARRMHPTLDRLWPGGANRPTAFCHVVGKEEVQTVATAEGNQMSRSNETEADMAVKIAMSMVREHKIRPEDVMLLSQYRAQCALIKKKLSALKDERLDRIGVNSVVAAQGSEWDYVIFSTVRSLPQYEIEPYTSPSWLRKHLGSIMDQNQVNVAITRAKRGLCIIGNKNLLRIHSPWKELISDYEEQKCLVANSNFMARGTSL